MFSILFYMAAGAFIYMITLLSFIKQPSWAEKFSSVDLLILSAVLALVLGAIVTFWGWKSFVTGITLISAVGFAILAIITIFYLSLLPEFKEAFPNNNFNSFSDYRTGCLTLFILLIIGSTLIVRGGRKSTRS